MKYQNLAERTEVKDWSRINLNLEPVQMMRLVHAGMGMCTEAGEFQDALKKAIFYRSALSLDITNLTEEVGDMLWYCALACNAMGVDMEGTIDFVERLLGGYTITCPFCKAEGLTYGKTDLDIIRKHKDNCAYIHANILLNGHNPNDRH